MNHTTVDTELFPQATTMHLRSDESSVILFTMCNSVAKQSTLDRLLIARDNHTFAGHLHTGCRSFKADSLNCGDSKFLTHYFRAAARVLKRPIASTTALELSSAYVVDTDSRPPHHYCMSHRSGRLLLPAEFYRQNVAFAVCCADVDSRVYMKVPCKHSKPSQPTTTAIWRGTKLAMILLCQPSFIFNIVLKMKDVVVLVR